MKAAPLPPLPPALPLLTHPASGAIPPQSSSPAPPPPPPQLPWVVRFHGPRRWLSTALVLLAGAATVLDWRPAVSAPATAPATAPLEATNWVEERPAPLYGLGEREDEDEEGAFYDANDGAGAARSPGRKLPAGSAYINIYSPAYGDTYSQNEAIDVDWTYSSDSGSYVYLYIVSLLHRPH
jgi:hypothetical protein